MNKQPYKNFDLPTTHLDYSHDYIPARTRNSDEAERRRSLPSGTLLLEQQQRGLVIAGEILQHIENPDDLDFAMHILSMSAFNSSWYSYGRGSQVMRRRLELPTMTDLDGEWYQTPDDLLLKVKHGLAEAAGLANTLVYKKTRGLEMDRSMRKFGHEMGNLALTAGALRMSPFSSDPFAAQTQVREQSLQLVHDARTVGLEIGTHLSIAQLADQDSPLSIEWRRQAPDESFEALQRAVALAA